MHPGSSCWRNPGSWIRNTAAVGCLINPSLYYSVYTLKIGYH